jgi:uroporphyrinogen decarboxylase
MVEGGGRTDFERVKLWALREPDEFAALIDCLVAATIDYLGMQIAAGAEAIQLFDSWAGVLAESEFRRWVIEPTKRIVEALKARHPGVPVIGFPRMAGLLYETYRAETGVDALGLDTTVPLAAARRLQRAGAVQGNLDPLLLVAGGPALEEGARRVITALGEGPFVFNLGHGVVPQTPPEHVERLAAIVRGG